MKLHQFMIGFLFVSILILGFLGPTGYLIELKNHNDLEADFSSLNNTQSALEEQEVTINKTMNNFQTMDFELGDPTTWASAPAKLIAGSWNALKTVFGSYTFITAMISDVIGGLAGEGIPIPSWVIGSIVAIIIMCIIAILIYGYFKWRFEL